MAKYETTLSGLQLELEQSQRENAARTFEVAEITFLPAQTLETAEILQIMNHAPLDLAEFLSGTFWLYRNILI